MLNLAVFALILTQLAISQVVVPPANTPQCLITCSTQFCPTSDLSCICVTSISNITTCVLSSCSSVDQQTAAQIAESICVNFTPTSVVVTSTANTATGVTARITIPLERKAEMLATTTPASSTSASGVTTKTAASSSYLTISGSASSATSSASAQKSEGNHNKAFKVAALGLACIAAGFIFI